MIENVATNTYPIVFHAPGSARKKLTWRGIRRYTQERIQHINPYAAIPVPSYAIISWSNRKKGETCLEQSLENWGITPSTLPKKGAKQTGNRFYVLRKRVKDWVNREHKVALTKSILEKLDVQYVIGLDAFDVVLAAHPDEIVRRFVAWPYISQDGSCPQMLFNASVVRFPQDETMLKACDEMERHIVETRRHLNAGVWIASKEYAVDFWNAVDAVGMGEFKKCNRRSEQAAVRYVARSDDHYPDVQIDRHCRIFQHMTLARLQMQ